jgi:FAD/FMN-containing dehydrogenase
MSMDIVTLPRQAVDELRSRMRGQLLESGDDGYEAARTVYNAMFDRRPALIARCAGAADVIAALAAGRELGLPIAVRGGGHSVAGHSTCDGGLVIDVGPMKGIRVDPTAQTVRAQAGLTWGEFDREVQAFGLAVTGGRVTTTGIAGFTLGSGSGWIERRFGLTADNMLGADVVTADGRLIHASADEHPDLFFGLRGGGGNFGIVTEFEFQLHQLGPMMFGGLIAHPGMRAPEFIRFYRDLMADAPDDLGGAVVLITAPPAPFIPEELHGKQLVAAVATHTGSLEEGERVVTRLREFGPAPIDHLGPMPYTAVQALIDGGNQPGFHNYWKAENLTGLPDAAIDAVIEGASTVASPHTQVVLIPLGGAVGRVDEDATAISGRAASWQYHAIGMWDGGADADANIAWARSAAGLLEPHIETGVSLNFTSDTGDERVATTFGSGKIERLREIKRTYDPENVFRLNQNIAP